MIDRRYEGCEIVVRNAVVLDRRGDDCGGQFKQGFFGHATPIKHDAKTSYPVDFERSRSGWHPSNAWLSLRGNGDKWWRLCENGD